MNECMICLDKCNEPRIDCKCKGTNRYIHTECLRKWYETKTTPTFTCPHCKTKIHVFFKYYNTGCDIRQSNLYNRNTVFVMVSACAFSILIIYILLFPPFLSVPSHRGSSQPTPAPTKILYRT